MKIAIGRVHGAAWRRRRRSSSKKNEGIVNEQTKRASAHSKDPLGGLDGAKASYLQVGAQCMAGEVDGPEHFRLNRSV